MFWDRLYYNCLNPGVFLPVNIRLYKEVSANVMEILRGFAEKFEQVSVDEAYLVPIDLISFDNAVLFAYRIKDEIQILTFKIRH